MYITKVHWSDNDYDHESTDTFVIGIYLTKKEAEKAVNIFYTAYKHTKNVSPLTFSSGHYTFDTKTKYCRETYEFEINEIEVGKTYTDEF